MFEKNGKIFALSLLTLSLLGCDRPLPEPESEPEESALARHAEVEAEVEAGHNANAEHPEGHDDCAECENTMECDGEDDNAADAHHVDPAKLLREGAPRIGPADAPVTLVVASDFECPFCAKMVDTLDELQARYGSRLSVVFRHSPLPMHRNAVEAAIAAEAAHRQGQFWQMHDLLLAGQRELGEESYQKWAAKLGLDMERFSKDLADPDLRALVEADVVAMREVGARGTPNIWINGEQLVGARPASVLAELIDEALAQAAAGR